MTDLRLVIFDVDGTLVDSQNDILAAMTAAFSAGDLPAPSRAEVLGIVGLSLDIAVARLAPGLPATAQGEIVAAYKSAYMALRARNGVAHSSPLYPGVRAVLEQLHAVPHLLLGVATGKSGRGLDKLFDGHDLHRFFTNRQVADHHPSKPHPSMILAALQETGIAARHAVMVGDTSYDMEMARTAGVAAIGVSWGYHRAEQLSAAQHVIDDIHTLPALLGTIWEVAA